MASTNIELIGRRVKIKNGKEKKMNIAESLGETKIEKALLWIGEDEIKTKKITLKFDQIQSYKNNFTNMDIVPKEKIAYKKAFIYEFNLRAPTYVSSKSADEVLEFYGKFYDSFVEKYNAWKSKSK